jgi:hypothetical protein
MALLTRVAKGTALLALGVVLGFLAGAYAMAPSTTAAAVRNRYKVEQLERMHSREPAALQALLDQRAAEGWFLQALDHETLIFRRAAAPRPTPSPEQ